MKRKASDLPIKKRKMNPVPVTLVDKSLARRISTLEKSEEVKYTDLFVVQELIPLETTPNWALHCLNTGVQGTASAGQHVGTTVSMKKLFLRMSFKTATANIVDNRVRILVFWVNNPETILPNPNQMWDLSVVTAPTYAPFNEQYKKSFSILYDRTIELKPLDWNGTTTTIGDQISINKIIPLKNRKTRYVAAAGGGTFADIIDNALYIAVVTSANSGAAQVNNPFWNLGSRAYYTDA